MHRFITRHADKITGVLSGFDRLVFRGQLLPLCHDEGVRQFLTSQGVLLKHFGKFVETVTAMIRDGAATVAGRLGLPVRYLESSRVRKEDVANRILAERPIRSGAICMLSIVEPCSSWQVRRSREHKHPQQLLRRFTKCLHHYHYFLDSELGFCHVRVQTWMPYMVQICINGREWLGRQLQRERLRHTRADNCFPHLASPDRVHEIMDEMLRLPWPSVLGNLIRRANPVLADVADAARSNYYWTVHQAEWATDIMFKDPGSLARSYPALVRHALTDFQSPDVLRFLAKRSSSYRGEVTTDYKRRVEGVRVKHSAKANSVKMYDKAGSVLRVETTINQPGEFKVRRRAQGKPDSDRQMRPLRKGIADIRALARTADRSNRAYLDALSVVDDSHTVAEIVMPVTNHTSIGGRRLRGLRPWADPDLPLLQAIGRGEFLLHGFRNRDLVPLLFPGAVASDQRKKLSAKVTRLLRLLRAHGLIKKVEGTHRYNVTTAGRRLIAAVVAAGAASLSQLKQCA
ncbi:MAG: hypothetical protein ACREQ8_18715 [Woeseiaceae bacterium]